MKARMPLSNKTKRIIRQAADQATDQVLKEKQFKIVNRVLKVACYALNLKFGFANKRLTEFLSMVFKVLDEKDEVFWEHLDIVVIDELNLPFEREKVDLNGEPIDSY